MQCTLHVVRLVNGSAQYEGRVEILYNGEWGTVCDDRWDLNDAKVVCKQLDYFAAITTRDGAYYGKGTGRILLDNVNCIGTELNIEDCSHNSKWGLTNCNHDQDAGVKCRATNGKYSIANCYIFIQYNG